jgi:hypothetical protein
VAAGSVVELAADGRASVGVALSGRGDGRVVVVRAAAAGLGDPFPVLAVATVAAGCCPPAALVPRPAQPAVNVTAATADA